jgi:large subunit ribosomal protein L34e
MVSPRLRSRSTKKTQKRTATRSGVQVYKRGKPSPAICAICHTNLHAVPRRRPSEMGKLSKTEKRPERMFAGVLCHDCVSRLLKQKVRMSANSLKREDVSLTDLKYIAMIK